MWKQTNIDIWEELHILAWVKKVDFTIAFILTSVGNHRWIYKLNTSVTTTPPALQRQEQKQQKQQQR